MGAAVVAGSVAAPESASADVPNFSFFGFGNGRSDAYNQIDDDSYSPYDQFSSGKDRMFKADDKVYLEKKKVALDESFKRLEKIPKLIKGKESENLKSLLTLQLYTMRFNMEYFTTKGAPFYRDDDESKPAFAKANQFFQDIADLTVYGKAKKWPEATTAYNAALLKLEEWKKLVGY